MALYIFMLLSNNGHPKQQQQHACEEKVHMIHVEMVAVAPIAEWFPYERVKVHKHTDGTDNEDCLENGPSALRHGRASWTHFAAMIVLFTKPMLLHTLYAALFPWVIYA